MTGTPTKNLAQVAEALIAAFNAGDWAQFRAALAPDVVYEETGTQRRTQNADEYLQLVEGWKQALPDAKGTIRNVVSSGNTVVLEITWTGNTIQEVHHHLDVLSMLQQLGALPAAG
jgi:steroid delta-isomerase-like uncharacterized protein